MSPSPASRAWIREILAALFFIALTIVTTWPLAKNMGHAVSDPGDPYLTVWILDWNLYSLTHAPASLFHGNIFSPSRWTLAFSEHFFGVALPFLPLYLFGVAPVAIFQLAVIVGFAFSGYGAWRLAHTVTGNIAGSLAAGIFFAFVPYRFDHLAHLHIIWSGWVPLVLAALIALWRTPGRRQSLLFGGAFLMNGISNIHWLLFAGLATTLTVPLLFMLGAAETRRDFLRRWLISTVIASILIVPLLIPYAIVSREYGMKRHAGETQSFSAEYVHWLSAPAMSRRYSDSPLANLAVERALFPGVVPIIIAALALTPLALRRKPEAPDPLTRVPFRGTKILRTLDVLAILSLVIAIAGKGASAQAWLFPAAALFLARCMIALPAWMDSRHQSLRDWIREAGVDPGVLTGLLWTLLGFFGALGLNGAMHTFLFKYVPGLQAIRVPARWAVIAYAGMALLIAIGVASLLRARRSWRKPLAAAALIALIGWDIQPRPILWYLAPTFDSPARQWMRELPRNVSTAELPISTGHDVKYMVGATIHHRPLVNGASGFNPADHSRIVEIAETDPISDDLLSKLRDRGTDLIIVHGDEIGARDGRYLEWLRRNRSQMRYLGRFDHGTNGDYLFWIGSGEPPVDRSLQRDAAGMSGLEALDRFLAGQAVYAGSTAGVLESPSFGEGIAGELEVRGWASSPHGISRINVYFDGGDKRYGATREPRADLAMQYPWFSGEQLTGFRLRVPKRPRGVGLRTNMQIEIIDGRNAKTRLETIDITWFHGFPRPPIAGGEWQPDRLLALLTRMSVPDPAGVAARIMRGETTIQAYVDPWVQSTAGGTSRDFINRAYGTFLQRRPDPGGFELYTQELSNGFPRRTMIEKFIGSEEFRREHLRR